MGAVCGRGLGTLEGEWECGRVDGELRIWGCIVDRAEAKVFGLCCSSGCPIVGLAGSLLRGIG